MLCGGRDHVFATDDEAAAAGLDFDDARMGFRTPEA